MANRNDLVVTAGLNIEASVSQITKDLGEVSKKIPADALKIKCSIDTSNIKAIKSQLSSLSKNLKIDLFSNTEGNGNKKVTDAIVKDFNDTFNMVGKMGETTKKVLNSQTKQMLQDFKDAWQEGLDTGNTTAYYEALDKLGKRINDFSKGDIKLLKEAIIDIRREFSDGSIVSIGDSLKKDLDYLTGSDSLTRKHLDALYGSGKYTIGSGNAGYDTLMQRDEEASTAILNAAKKIIEYQDKIRSVGWGLDELQEVGLTAKEIENNIEDAVRQILGLPELPRTDDYIDINVDDDIEEVKELTSNVRAYDDAIKTAQKDTANFSYPDNIGFSKNTEEILANAKKIIGDELAQNAETANDKVSRIKKAVEDAEGGLQAFVVQVEKENKSVENLTYALNEQGDAYVYLGKTIREADNSTDFRRKDVATQWQIQTEKLIQFANNADKAGFASTSLKEDIKDLFATLNKANPDVGGDTSTMNAFLDKFDIAKAKLQTLNATVRNESFTSTLSNKVQKLSADMNAFATANERAVKSTQLMSTGKSFAQEWQELANTLSKGNLSSEELKHLRERFAIFGKEAEAAGLKGKTAWEKFLKTFKTFTSYISANMVFNMVKRQISNMITEVVNLDSAMTELRKVTEATEPEFNKFLETAKQSAQYLGSSVTDLVDATSTFSRLGYSLSEAQNLGEIATLYKNVGDGIDISTASESIVSTLKAFKIEAADAIQIVDKFNEVGNNFAISSGGIGEALLRSASALATANNDLSQSIALITTANTVAQNPEMVGTGLKTMALRLRSTKTELEEMGEDAEGAAENVSKLREQVLALTKNKVDIQIDENTYKSSYQILLEISKVWNEINDISQASLLEQLFGKRQANVGAAILENGDLLQDVYETAEHSINSATKEQEKFSKSIQYSINSFKAAYQTLSSDVVKSGFIKEVVDFGSTVIKGLDFIITKTGILQGILTGFGSLAIFKAIPALFTKIKSLGTSFSALGAISNTLGADGQGNQLMSLEQLGNVSKLLTDDQFQLILSTKDLTDAQIDSMMTARGFTKEQIAAQLAIRKQTFATNGLTVAEEGAEMATFSLSNAFKGLKLAIASNPIGAIITGVTLLTTALISWKRKQEEAVVEAKRLEEERQRNLKETISELESFEQEQSSIDSLIEKYVELYNTTSDMSTKKEELASITEELNGKFEDEKTGIDLLNGSISENIELIREQQNELDKQWQRDNKAKIEEAQKYIADNSDATIASFDVNGVLLGSNYDEAVQEAEFYYDRMLHMIDTKNEELWKYLDKVETTYTDSYGNAVRSFGFKLKEGIDRDVIPEVLKSFRDLYEQLDQYSYMDFKFISGDESAEALNLLISDFTQYIELLQKDESISNSIFDNTAIAIDGTAKKFNELAEAASDASRKMNAEGALPADVYTYSRQLNEIRVELEELAKASPELQKRFELIFSTIGLQSEDVSESAELLRKNFFDTLDEMEDGVFKRVDKINDAITKAFSGEGLSATEAWELLELDTTGILTPVIEANGEWIMQSEQLVALKERLIGLSREQVEADLKSAQTQIADLDNQISAQYAIIDKQREIIAKTMGNSKPNEANLKALSDAKKKVNELVEVQKKYSAEVYRDKLLLQQLNAQLDYTVEQQKALVEKAEDYADNLLKAQEHRIDQIIDSHEAEKEALEKEKEALQDELDILNDQKDAIEEIISNYDTVNNLVQKTVEKEIDSLEEQKQAIEDTYNARIDALKAENEERNDALEYAEKLANLENAKKNKSRVYDETRGWRYESVKEDVKKAENELAEFETSQEIKKLEKERDELTKGIDDQIDSYKDYEDIWKEIAEEIQTEEDELLAEQILGADWREKIAQKDTAVMDKFRSEYRNHNVALNNLTNTEIALKEAAIEAKDAEIKSKEEQIKIWKAYKTEVQTAAKDIKDATEGYIELLDTVTINETSDLQTRTENLNNFKNAYSGALQTAIDLQNQLDNNGGEINYDVHVNGLDELKQAAAAATVIATTAGMTGVGGAMVGVGGVMAIANSPILQSADDIADTVKDILNRIGLYSSGGVADYTGLAMLHGRKDAPEVIFNASDSAKLYELVHGTPNLMADMIDKATKLSQFNMAKVGSTTNTSSVNIDSINVYANNPAELSRGLDKELDRYFQTKLTQNYTSRS